MFDQVRWPWRPWIGVLGGLGWLYHAADAGLLFFLFTALFALPMGGGALAIALGQHDLRANQTWALGSALGALLALPCGFAVGFGTALPLLLVSAASFVLSGREAIEAEPVDPRMPAPERTLRNGAKTALDETFLGIEQFMARLPVGEELAAMHHEIAEAVEIFEDRGWSADPTTYHTPPPPLEHATRTAKRAGRHDYEHVVFESGYEPHPDEPGRARYLALTAPRTAHAWLRVHPGEDRPWLVCNNGYRLGHAPLDVAIFGDFYDRLGLNLLIPVLPMHGPRRIGRMSGDGWFTGHPLDTVHAVAQAQWDIRRLIGWLRRERGATQIGTVGLSLGGYTTSLLAGLEPGLSCAIPGIGVSCFAAIIRRHLPSRQWAALEHAGIDEAMLRRVFRPISPLAVEPMVPYDGRFLFGAVADRLVPPQHILALHEHWEQPEIVWHQGGHMTAPLDRRVLATAEMVLRTTKLAP